MQNKLKAWALSISLLLSCAAWGQLVPEPCKGPATYTTESLLARDEPECSLREAPACQRIRPASTDVIFTGVVIKIADSEGRMLVNGDCDKTLLQTVRVRVTESYKGNVTGFVIIHAGDINGFYFLPRKSYLIVARHRSDGDLDVTRCGGTKALADAKAEVDYLRSWPSLPKRSSLFGTARIGAEDPRLMVQKGARLKNASINISGGATFNVKTDSNGNYKMENLPPGSYTLSLGTPFYIWPARSQTVQLIERGCSAVDFYVVTNKRPDGSFSAKPKQLREHP